ncbi:MAG: tetratricopeptide repeat protein [Pseudobdellovibrio sp.]
MIKFIVVCFLLIFNCIAGAESKASAKLGTEKRLTSAKDVASINKIKLNLAKIQKSIDLTKFKIKSPQDVEYLPDLYFSLAELQLEKARLMYALKLESKPGIPVDEIDFTAEKRVKQEAIEVYQNIKDRFAQFPQRDKVLYALAQELKDIGDSDNSLKTFKELIEKYPQSSLWEKTQLQIGNIFFEKKDYEFAKQQYLNILKREEKSISAVAQFKIGQCEIQLEQFLNSSLAFEKAVIISKKYNTTISLIENEQDNIKEEALIASVWPLSELAAEQLSAYPRFLKPVEYYLQLTDDKAVYRRVLLRLARRLKVKTREFEAAQVYYEILRLADDPEMKREALEGYYLGIKKAKKQYYPDGIVVLMSDTFRSFKLQNIEYQRYEPLYRDIATSVHKIGQSSKRPADLENAIAAYRDYLYFFSKSKYKKDIQINTAEALYMSGQLIQAGLEFLKLGLTNSSAKEKKDFLNSSIKSLTESLGKSAELSALERAQSRIVYRKVAESFLKVYPHTSESNDIAFNISKTFYDEKDYKLAVPKLKNFLTTYPRSARSQEAALLLLDTYFTRDDLKGLVSEGKEILAINGLNSDVRKKVQDIIQQSQIKNVRNIAGEFGTKEYSNKILQFAKSNKSSDIGETALFEAFVSLRSANDEKVFSVGEDFLGTFPNSARGKEILLSMAQMSLVTVDFSKASKYLIAYAQKYPQDSQAKGFLTQAALISEQIGYFDEAILAYRSLGQLDKVALFLEKSGHWNELLQEAPKLSGVKSLYYSALANLKLNKKEESLNLFRRLVQQSSNNDEEKEMIGRAGYSVAENEINEFKETGKKELFTPQSLKARIAMHQDIERSLQNIISLGVGKWTIGALYLSGKLNTEFTLFLRQAAPPTGMTQQKLANVLAPQIKNYQSLADVAFNKCMSVAEGNDVFTDVVFACRSRSAEAKIDSKPMRQRTIASTNPELINARKNLYKSPRDLNILASLARNLVKLGDYSQALATTSRMIEYEPNNMNWLAEAGVVYIYLNEVELAVATFKETLKKSPQDKTALWGLAGIYKKYGFLKQASILQAKAQAAGRPNGMIHPWMTF